MIDDTGIHFTKVDDIKAHDVNFHETLYREETCDEEKQEYFLGFLQNELSDSDRETLSAPISKPEIVDIIKSMAHNKTPGNDGLPLETYEENWNSMGNDLLTLYNPS